MKKTLYFLALFCLIARGGFAADRGEPRWKYPATKKMPVTDVYFGRAVKDDYRWLEAVDKAEVKDWLKAQNDFTNSILDRIPGRDALIDDFVKLDKLRPARFGEIVRRGGRYFFRKTLADETVGRIFYREGENGGDVLLFDPTAGAAGKSMSVTFFRPSEDGKRLALGIAEGGSMASTIRVMDVDRRTLFPESITPSWVGVTGWTRDGKGFLYNLLNSGDVYDKNRELNTRTLYHVVGTDPKEDREIFSAAKCPGLGIRPRDFPLVEFSEDFRYLFGYVYTVESDLTVYVAPAAELDQEVIRWRPLLKPEDQVTAFCADGDTLYLLSHKDAPRYRILATDLRQPDAARASEVLAQGRDVIQSLSRCRDYLLAVTSDGVNCRLRQWSFRESKWNDVSLPLPGTVAASGYDVASNDCLVFITSWKTPGERYDYDPKTGSFARNAFNNSAEYPGVNDIVIEEVEVPSHDGAMVPLTILYNKDLKKDGSAACLLKGYGAYGTVLSPEFSWINLSLVNRRVIVAVAHVRGGGEKGRAWQQAGFKKSKPNTWKDFIACAEYLVKNRYTSPGKLFGRGMSAGGIMIGRAITERPDLFAAAICNVGCANTLRMENSPNGPANAPEFGTVKDRDECAALMEMDALLHVREGEKYPAVICVGGINDPNVIIWQPAKFAAALQNASISGKPVLLQVNYESGHFTEDKRVDFRSDANMYAFCLWQTGHPDFQAKK